MKSALSDTLVICDMDNTLLTAKEGLPACNRTVINLFTSLGGLFTVATGRPPESIRAALEGIRLSLLPAASKLFYRLLLTLFVPVIAGLTDFKYAGQIVGFQI